MSEITLFACSCSSEGLSLDVDEDGASISLWRLGATNESWKYRLRHIWYIIKRGHPFTDDVILDWPTAEKFARHILAVAESQPEAEKPVV